VIELQQGDILKAEADALVNTVNCVGAMGRGIALQFKKAFPDMCRAYESVCKRKGLTPGQVLSYDLNRFEQPHYVINFPTKDHWRGKSRMEYIETGLEALIEEVRRLDIQSVAVPPLGCGLGGLDWKEVRPRIEQAFEALPNVRVLLFEPQGAPPATAMPKNRKAPQMTAGRALLLALMRRYLAAVMDSSVTLLEIHKLMYFMQESGQDLRLRYTKGQYGPYAENLRHVLTHIEGYFIDGYGDAEDAPNKPIYLKKEAAVQAEEYLKASPEIYHRLGRVANLIEGFETAYGMELLATVHWVVHHEAAANFEEVVQKTYAWNKRKQMFSQEHLQVAWNALNDRKNSV